MESTERNELNRSGLSWYDIKAFMFEIGKAHNGSVWVTCTQRPTPTGKTVLCWYVKFKFGPVGHDFCEQYAVGHDWPASDWKTVTNMVYALLVQLDFKITEGERKRERQSSF